MIELACQLVRALMCMTRETELYVPHST